MAVQPTKAGRERLLDQTARGSLLREFQAVFKRYAGAPIRSQGLFVELVAREISARYRGSVLGIFWVIAQPLVLLAVYTFAFGVILRSPWGSQDSTVYMLKV